MTVGVSGVVQVVFARLKCFLDKCGVVKGLVFGRQFALVNDGGLGDSLLCLYDSISLPRFLNF